MNNSSRFLNKVEDLVQRRTFELTSALETLKKAQEKAENLSIDKSNFMAFLCHELRNPLHAIIHMTTMLLEDLFLNPNLQNKPRKERAGNLSPADDDPILRLVNGQAQGLDDEVSYLDTLEAGRFLFRK